MSPVRSQELMRDFIRSRQNWDLFGWPCPPLYSEHDATYFQMLERDRLAGRVQIEGEIKTIDDYENVLHR